MQDIYLRGENNLYLSLWTHYAQVYTCICYAAYFDQTFISYISPVQHLNDWGKSNGKKKEKKKKEAFYLVFCLHHNHLHSPSTK